MMGNRRFTKVELLAARLSKARDQVKRLDLEALVVAHLPNLFYLSNFQASSGLLVLTPENGQLLVDFRYQQAVADLIAGNSFPPDIKVFDVSGSYEESLSGVIRESGWSRVGVESEHVSLRFWQWLRQSFTGSIVETESGSALIHCFAGCTYDAVLDAIGLQPSDLFPTYEYIAGTKYLKSRLVKLTVAL